MIREGKHPTPARSSHPVPCEAERELKLKPNHGTNHITKGLFKQFLSGTSYSAILKNYNAYQMEKETI